MELQRHEPARVSAVQYVEWFHRKFKNPYSKWMFSSIKADHIAIIDSIERYDIRTFLEIGTWKGYTALLVYLHSNIERVKCLDIHKDMGVIYPGTDKEMPHALSDRSVYGSFFKDTFVHLQFADTMTYSHNCEEHDMVLIDGNHDYDHIKNDTQLAMSMNPKIIMWHDYGSIGSGVARCDVKQYIDELVANGSIIAKFDESLCVAAGTDSILLSKKENM